MTSFFNNKAQTDARRLKLAREITVLRRKQNAFDEAKINTSLHCGQPRIRFLVNTPPSCGSEPCDDVILYRSTIECRCSSQTAHFLMWKKGNSQRPRKSAEQSRRCGCLQKL